VPGGSVPAGAFRGGITAGVGREVEFDRFEKEEFSIFLLARRERKRSGGPQAQGLRRRRSLER